MGSVQLQKFFDAGRKLAHKGRTVMYWFDEADVLMGHRGAGNRSHKEDDKLLDTLMKNLQDIASYGEREYLFFATNFRDGMDQAAIRSKRIDEIVDFPMPNKDGIKNAYIMKIAHINTRTPGNYRVIRQCNTDNLAVASNGFSYADVEAVIEATIRTKAKRYLRQSVKEEDNSIIIKAPHIVHKDLMYEIEKMQFARKIRSGAIGFA